MERSPYRDWLALACRYCEDHPPKYWSAASCHTVDQLLVYGLYGPPLNPRIARDMQKREPRYVFPNSFEVKEYVSSVPPLVYTVKVIRRQHYADGAVSKVSCCAKGKSKKSIEAAYEPCCRKMFENFGLTVGSKSLEEAVLKLVADGGVS